MIRASGFRNASLFPLFALVGSCGLTDPDLESDGVVRFIEVEGGCWVIDTPHERVEPLNLPVEFRVDGLGVFFEASAREDLASVCQVGRMVELDFIQVTAS